MKQCDRCGKDLVPDHNGCEHSCMWHRPVEPGQWDNALEVNLNGGYGMFIDPPFSGHPTEHSVVLCHECAHELADQEPWLRKAIGDPERSHTHKEGTVPEEHLAFERSVFGPKQP